MVQPLSGGASIRRLTFGGPRRDPGTSRICVGSDGTVSEVTAIKSIAGVDEILTTHVREKWRYEPPPFPVCFPRNFVFAFR